MRQDVFKNWSTIHNTDSIRLEAAQDFLQRGILDTVLGGTSCTTSHVCGAGFGCIQGVCKKLTGSGGGSAGSYSSYEIDGVWTAGGSCGDSPDGNGEGGTGGCASSSGSGGGPVGCTVETCGDAGGGSYGSSDSDCCGIRVCRFSASGGGLNTAPFVSCYCVDGDGDGYETGGPCNSYCDEYHKTNGEYGEACNANNTCNECNTCYEGRCTEKTSGAPCHCRPEREPWCTYCREDGTTGRFLNDCNLCCTRQKKCCNGNTYTVQSCGRWYSTQLLCLKAEERLQELCGTCDGEAECVKDSCIDKREEQPGGGCSDPTELAEGAYATITGCISTNDQSFLLYKECTGDEEAKCCPQPSCTCNAECPAGSNCGTDGECTGSLDATPPVSDPDTTPSESFYNNNDPKP